MGRFTRALALTWGQALALAAILSLALATRLWWLLGHAPASAIGSPDELHYTEMARQLIAHGIYGYQSTIPNAVTMPGYPLFVAGVFKLADLLGGGASGELVALRVVQMLLGVLAVLLVFWLGRRVADVRVGLVAAAAVALYPSAITGQGRVLTETLFAALLLGWLLAALKLRESRGWRAHALLGGMLAMLVLVRPAAAPLGLLVYALALAETRDRRFVMGSVVALLAFCLVMSPWWVRNRVVLHQTVLLTVQSGDPFLRGTDPWDAYDKIGPSVVAGVPLAQMQSVGMERVQAGLRDHPAEYITWLTVGKWWYLWRAPWYEASGFSQVAHWTMVLVLGWIGVAFGLFDRRLRLLALSVAVMTAVQLAFIPIPRYVFPVAAVVMVLASWVVVRALDALASRVSRTVTLPEPYPTVRHTPVWFSTLNSNSPRPSKLPR